MQRMAMKRMSAMGAVIALAVAAGGAIAQQSALSESKSPAATSLVTGITAPSDVRKIGFDIRGVVAKVSVKKNDPVKAGQPLIALADAEERATYQQFKLAADTSLQVAEAEQTYNVKALEYQRKKSVYEADPNGSSELEMKTAEAEMNVAKIRIDEAKHEGDQNAARAEAQKARLDRMNRAVPADFADGQVSEVSVKEGEQVDETKPVIELVDLDPLYVNVTLADTAIVQKLKRGDTLRVKYVGDNEWRTATVDAIDPSANSASGKHPFRLSLPNPEQRNAGLRVDVELPAASGVATRN